MRCDVRKSPSRCIDRPCRACRVLTIVKFMSLLKMRRKKIFSRLRHNKDWFIKRQSICLSSVGGEVNLRLRLQNHWKSCTGAVRSHPWDDTFRLQLSSLIERARKEKKISFHFRLSHEKLLFYVRRHKADEAESPTHFRIRQCNADPNSNRTNNGGKWLPRVWTIVDLSRLAY